MAAPNPQLLGTLGELWRNRSSAAVLIDSGRVQRTLHVERGELVAAESDVLTERIGVQLVADGMLDPAAVNPLVDVARKARRPFGELLVAERLISMETLAKALERQLWGRFDRALQMTGAVAVKAQVPVTPVARRPLAAAVVAAFRRVPVELAAKMVLLLPPHHPRLREDLFTAQQLELEEPEERHFRQLAAGMDAVAVLDRAPDYDCAVRLCAALVGLGALPTEKPDPVAQYLRSA